MNTIVELYDDEQILNVLMSLALRPENVVFVGNFKIEQNRDNIERFFKQRKLEIAVHFFTVDVNSASSILSVYEQIILNFPECAFDVSGGRDLPLVMAGIFCAKNQISMYWFDKRKETYFKLSRSEKISETKFNEVFTANDFITLAGGSALRRGHFFSDDFNASMYGTILEIWDIFFYNQKAWSKNAMFFQQISKPEVSKNFVDTLTNMKIDSQRSASCVPHIMKKLSDIGVITNLEFYAKRVKFEYKNDLFRRWLSDIGIWLELYTYIQAKNTGFFDFAQVSVIVDWDAKTPDSANTINEIDVILTKGLIPIFISCKVGLPSTNALNELFVLTERFGGAYAKAVLVTASNFSAQSPRVYQRAIDLGINVIQREDIENGRLAKKLIKIVKTRNP